MFPIDTYLKVIKYLNKTIADEAEVKSALATAEATPEVEVEITNILTQMDELDAALLAERSSPNSAMTRADVVEWEPGQRSKGMTTALNILRQQLANLLGVEYQYPSTCQSFGTITFDTRTILWRH